MDNYSDAYFDLYVLMTTANFPYIMCVPAACAPSCAEGGGRCRRRPAPDCSPSALARRPHRMPAYAQNETVAALQGLFEWAQTQPRIAGLCPWHYNDRCGLATPPRRCHDAKPPCDMDRGAASMPLVRAQLEKIGRAIISGSWRVQLATDDVTLAIDGRARHEVSRLVLGCHHGTCSTSLCAVFCRLKKLLHRRGLQPADPESERRDGLGPVV